MATADVTLSADQARWVRLVGHGLAARRRPGGVVEVASAVCGLQAQLDSSPGLSVRVRRPGTGPAEVRAELLERRGVVRTWLQRGTLHVVASEELALYAAAVGASVTKRETRLWERRGLPAAEVGRVNDVVLETLAGGPLTRAVLAERVAAVLGPAAGEVVGHPWGIGLKPAAASGLICFGAPAGREVTFTRVDDWLGPAKEWQEVDARAWVLRRFLIANGPSTRSRFARWSGLSAGEVAGAWSALEAGLRPVGVAGHTCWYPADHPLPATPGPPALYLLPAFDAFTLGAPDPGALAGPDHVGDIFRKAGWISPVVLAGGRAAGTWKLTRSRGQPRVTLNLFRPLQKSERSDLEPEIAGVEQFAAGDAKD
ncbi:MAG: winged helix DNA-binding domain-containing protein [Acidimicrobiia bacterium]